jgi:hypothetical protein
MYCVGVLTFDGGFMDSSSSRTKFGIGGRNAALSTSLRARFLEQREKWETPSQVSAQKTGANMGHLLPLLQLYRRCHGLPVAQHLDFDYVSDFAAA